jgi:hypothetical protein
MPLPDLRREKSSTNMIEALGNRSHIRTFATEVDSAVPGTETLASKPGLPKPRDEFEALTHALGKNRTDELVPSSGEPTQVALPAHPVLLHDCPDPIRKGGISSMNAPMNTDTLILSYPSRGKPNLGVRFPKRTYDPPDPR